MWVGCDKKNWKYLAGGYPQENYETNRLIWSNLVNYKKTHGNQLKTESSHTCQCIAIFHKYICYIKHGGIITNLNLWNPWGYVTDMSQCGFVEHGLECFLSYVQKHIAHLAACFGPLADSQRAARISETHYWLLSQCISRRLKGAMQCAVCKYSMISPQHGWFSLNTHNIPMA